MRVKSNKIARFHVNGAGGFRCAICGAPADITRFKNGYICNNCLEYVKSQL